jgi:Mycothiol maleylpyruvate isomerase N-terminal domain
VENIATRPTDKGTLLEREREAWASWWSHVTDVDPAATRCDGWSLKDVISHVAAWQRYSSGRLATIGRGRPDPGPPPDTDDFNELARKEALDRSWHEVRLEAERVHDGFIEAIESLSPEALTRDEGLTAFVVTVNGVEHYAEHLRDEFSRR